jgi:hypothetical protein
MEQPPEKNAERIIGKETILEIIARHVSNAEVVREVLDDEGASFLELKANGEKEGTFSEFNYRREKNKTGKDGETLLSIHQTFYEDDIPSGGKEILLRKDESGEWVEV